MEKNGGLKVIPTVIINDEILTAYDREKLKQILAVQ